MDDLEGVLDDAHRHQLLAVVAAVHHQGVGQSLHDRALRLAEPLGGVAAGAVRHVARVALLHRDVVLDNGRMVKWIISCRCVLEQKYRVIKTQSG